MPSRHSKSDVGGSYLLDNDTSDSRTTLSPYQRTEGQNSNNYGNHRNNQRNINSNHHNKHQFPRLPNYQRLIPLIDENRNATSTIDLAIQGDVISWNATKKLTKENSLATLTSNGEYSDWGLTRIQITNQDAAFVLGKTGRTKRKLMKVSSCFLNLTSDLVFEVAGTLQNRSIAVMLVRLIIQQRMHNRLTIDIDPNNGGLPPDVTTLKVPRSCVAFVTGQHGSVLRNVERDWDVIMFFAEADEDALSVKKEVISSLSRSETRCEAMHEAQTPEDEASDDDDDNRRRDPAREVQKTPPRPDNDGAIDHETQDQDAQADDSGAASGSADPSGTDALADEGNRNGEGATASPSRPLQVSGSDGFKTLVIFGSEGERKGAELKMMSAVEQKRQGHFTDHIREQINNLDEGFDTDCLRIPEQDFSYALGKEGNTRRKLGIAAGCVLEYIGHWAFIAGDGAARRRCREYLKWLLLQRRGSVRVDITSRDDVTPFVAPTEILRDCFGRRGMGRTLENETNTFCFINDRGNDSQEYATLLIFSCKLTARMMMKERLNDVLQDQFSAYHFQKFSPQASVPYPSPDMLNGIVNGDLRTAAAMLAAMSSPNSSGGSPPMPNAYGNHTNNHMSQSPGGRGPSRSGSGGYFGGSGTTMTPPMGGSGSDHPHDGSMNFFERDRSNSSTGHRRGGSGHNDYHNDHNDGPMMRNYNNNGPNDSIPHPGLNGMFPNGMGTNHGGFHSPHDSGHHGGPMGTTGGRGDMPRHQGQVGPIDFTTGSGVPNFHTNSQPNNGMGNIFHNGSGYPGGDNDGGPQNGSGGYGNNYGSGPNYGRGDNRRGNRRGSDYYSGGGMDGSNGNCFYGNEGSQGRKMGGNRPGKSDFWGSL